MNDGLGVEEVNGKRVDDKCSKDIEYGIGDGKELDILRERDGVDYQTSCWFFAVFDSSDECVET